MELNREQIYKLVDVEDVKKFIIGGKAFLTLESKKTGRWFTFKINKAKKDDENSPFFVSVLTGSDNENAYTYMGTIFKNNDKFNFRLTKKSTITEEALSYKAFNYFFNLLLVNKIHEDMGVYHRGMCARCGRVLTVPESILNGFGPECYGLHNKPISEIRKKKLQKINRINK